MQACLHDECCQPLPQGVSRIELPVKAEWLDKPVFREVSSNRETTAKYWNYAHAATYCATSPGLPALQTPSNSTLGVASVQTTSTIYT